MKLINKILSEYSIRMSFISERGDYHPEYSLLQHTLTVIDNVSKYNNNDLLISALFHDIGKIFTYEDNGNSYGHELTSCWLLMENKTEIEQLGVNFDKVYWIVKNHLKAGKIIDGETNKNNYKLLTHKWWPELELFAKADNMLDDSEKDLSILKDKKVFVSIGNDYLVGLCEFIGYNEIIKTKQVIIDRTPIRINNYNQVCSYFNIMYSY